MKATYSVTLISRQDTVSLSNMPATEEYPLTQTVDEDADTSLGRLKRILASLSANEPTEKSSTGWKVTKFEKSPPVRTLVLVVLVDIGMELT